MIGAAIGALWAIGTVGLLCYGSWYIQAHKKQLLKSNYDDLFAPWCITIVVSLFWPVGLPVLLAGALGNRARKERDAPDLRDERRDELRAKVELAKQRRRGTGVG